MAADILTSTNMSRSTVLVEVDISDATEVFVPGTIVEVLSPGGNSTHDMLIATLITVSCKTSLEYILLSSNNRLLWF